MLDMELAMLLNLQERRSESGSPLWPVTNSVGSWETRESMLPWPYVADALVGSLFAFECVLWMSLASSRDGDDRGVDLLLAVPLTGVLPSCSPVLRVAAVLNRFLMIEQRAMLAI